MLLKSPRTDDQGSQSVIEKEPRNAQKGWWATWSQDKGSEAWCIQLVITGQSRGVYRVRYTSTRPKRPLIGYQKWPEEAEEPRSHEGIETIIREHMPLAWLH